MSIPGQVDSIPHEAWTQGGYFVILLILAWAVYKSLGWLGREFFIPLRDAGKEYLKNQSDNTLKNTEALQDIKGTLINLTKATTESQKVSQDIHAGMQRLSMVQEETLKKLRRSNLSYDSSPHSHDEDDDKSTEVA